MDPRTAQPSGGMEVLALIDPLAWPWLGQAIILGMSIAPGLQSTTTVKIPATLPAGRYNLSVVVNGIASSASTVLVR